jgi:hypothetical protein
VPGQSQCVHLRLHDVLVDVAFEKIPATPTHLASAHKHTIKRSRKCVPRPSSRPCPPSSSSNLWRLSEQRAAAAGCSIVREAEIGAWVLGFVITGGAGLRTIPLANSPLQDVGASISSRMEAASSSVMVAAAAIAAGAAAAAPITRQINRWNNQPGSYWEAGHT